MSEAFATHFDPDLGRCDDCGSEEGTRTPVPRAITIGGVPTRVAPWLCEDCRPRENDPDKPYEYTVEYRRVMTVSSSEPLDRRQLCEHAADALHDGGALWSVLVEGKWYPVEQFASR